MSHLEIDVKSKLFPGDDMPGAAIPRVQLPLEVVADGGVVPVELLHGGDQDVHDLHLHLLADVTLDCDRPGRGPSEAVGVHNVSIEAAELSFQY